MPFRLFHSFNSSSVEWTALRFNPILQVQVLRDRLQYEMPLHRYVFASKSLKNQMGPRSGQHYNTHHYYCKCNSRSTALKSRSYWKPTNILYKFWIINSSWNDESIVTRSSSFLCLTRHQQNLYNTKIFMYIHRPYRMRIWCSAVWHKYTDTSNRLLKGFHQGENMKSGCRIEYHQHPARFS